MKNNLMKKFLVALAGIGLAITAMAQRGFDEFSVPRTFVMALPTNLIGSGLGTVSFPAVDTRGFVGVAKLDFMAYTNVSGSGQVLTATPQTSPDQTNWTSLGNYALISAYSTGLITNTANTALVGTNNVMRPGTMTTPTPATSGLAAVPYLTPLPYTNSGAITLTNNTPVEIGFSIEDIPNRYFRIILNVSGTTTNWTFGGALLTTPVPTYSSSYQ